MKKDVTNFVITIEKGKICLTVGETKTPRIPLDTEGESGANNIRVELGIAKVFHKALNLLKSDMDLFQREDFEFLGEMLSRILFGRSNNEEEWRHLVMKITEQNIDINNEDSDKICRIFLEFDQQSGVAMLPWEYTLYKTITAKPPESFYISANKRSRFHLIRRVNNMDHSIDNNSMLFLIVLTNAEGNSDVIPKIDGRQSELKDAKEFFTRLKTKYPGRLEIEYLDSTPRNQIKSEVERIYKSWKEKFKVQPCYGIHYFGHAMMRDQIGWLVAKDPETGRPGWIEDKKFATNFSEVLMEVKQPSMVCFQACDSAKIGTVSNQLRGVAYEFTKLNIPAVIGMQNEVQPTSSSVFFENFYDQVLQGKDVGEAVTFGRDYLGRVFGVDGEPYRNNSFGSPVLFITTAEPITIISNEEQAPEESSTEPVEKNVPLSKSLARVEENKSEEPERANANAQSDAVSKPINNPALKVVHDAHS